MLLGRAGRDARAASFGPTAASYARSRPPYPDAAIDWLLPPGATRVLDLGAGTGKLTASLIARGLEVVAVDPSGPMLGELRRLCPDADTREGRAESIPLPDADVDAVLVAQAWHWFDRPRTVAEIARVLRFGGALGLIWNTRDKEVGWTTRFERIVDSGDVPAYDGLPEVPLPFSGNDTLTLRWSRAFDKATFIDLVASRSAFLVLPEGEQKTMLERARCFFDEVADDGSGGRVLTMPYGTRGFRFALA